MESDAVVGKKRKIATISKHFSRLRVVKSSKRWVSSSILLPVQRGHILSSRATCRTYLFERDGCGNLLIITRFLLKGVFRVESR